MPQWKIPMAQYRYLYTQTWTKEVDEIFCNYLYYHALCGRDHTDPWNPDYGSLCTAAQGIRYLTGRSWKLDFFRDRLNILRLRRTSTSGNPSRSSWRKFSMAVQSPLCQAVQWILFHTTPSVSKPDVLFLGEKSRVEPDVIELVTSDDEI
ncbi:UNVERIFIED_CONTAM: hypothetical protein Sindi_1287900 [Sesamum indicum]